MSLHIITGADGTGKLDMLLNMLSHLKEQKFQETNILCPQIAAADVLGRKLSRVGIADIGVIDINRWITKLWEQKGGNRALIEPEQRNDILFQAASSFVDEKGDAERHSYLLSRGVHDILNDIVVHIGAASNISETSLLVRENAGEDIFSVWKRYAKDLDVMNLVERVDALAEMVVLGKSDAIDTIIGVYGFTGFDPAQLSFLSALARNNEVVVSLLYDEEVSGTEQIFGLYRYFKGILQETGGTEIYLPLPDGSVRTPASFADRMFGNSATRETRGYVESGALSFGFAQGKAAEISLIVKTCKEALESYEPNEIAIIFRGFKRNSYKIIEELERYGIAYSVDITIPLRATPLGAAFFSLVQMAPELATYTEKKRVSIIESKQKYGEFLRSSFSGWNDEIYFAADENFRSQEKYISSYETVYEALSSSTGRYSNKVVSSLKIAVRTMRLDDWKTVLDAMLSSSLEEERLSKFWHMQNTAAHHNMIEALSQAVQRVASAENIIDFAAFFELIYRGTVNLTEQKSATGGVLVSDSSRVRGREPKVVIIGGLSREEYRNAHCETPSERIVNAQIDGLTGERPDSARRARLQEELFAYEVLASAQEAVYLCIQPEDEHGEAVATSLLVDDVFSDQECFNSNQLFTEEFYRADIFQKQRFSAYLKNAGDPDSIDVGFGFGQRKRPDERLTLAPPFIPDRGVSVLDLYGDEERLGGASEREFSPSGIELFAKCPYGWFVDRYCPSGSLDEGMDAKAAGIAIHAILEDFYTTWTAPKSAGGKGQRRVVRENLDGALAHLHERFKIHPPRIARLDILKCANWTVEQVRWYWGLLKKAEHRIRKDADLLCGAADETFYPYRFEYKFGSLSHGDDSDVSPICKAHVGIVPIHGLVDRIDIDAEGRRYVVLDYKGGISTKEGLEILKSVKIQILLYLIAAQDVLQGEEDMTNDVNPAGAAYISYSKSVGDRGIFKNVSADTVGLKETNIVSAEEFDRVLFDATALAELAARNISEGRVPIVRGSSLNAVELAAAEMPCEYCGYVGCPAKRN
ncbi:MAG: PD-(D/E)XK nuclease family protein [Coriobacteriia bacterium]|nr:PD-(D/E)XK nuclease family protein [Coriobacteriia bacterium]